MWLRIHGFIPATDEAVISVLTAKKDDFFVILRTVSGKKLGKKWQRNVFAEAQFPDVRTSGRLAPARAASEAARPLVSCSFIPGGVLAPDTVYAYWTSLMM